MAPSARDLQSTAGLALVSWVGVAYFGDLAKVDLGRSHWHSHAYTVGLTFSIGAMCLASATFLTWAAFFARRHLAESDDWWRSYNKRARAKWVPAVYILALPLTGCLAVTLLTSHPFTAGVLTSPALGVDFLALANLTGGIRLER